MKGDSKVKNYRRVLIAMNGSKNVLVEGLRLIGNEKCNVTVVKVNPSYDGDLNLTGINNVEGVLNGEPHKSVAEIKEIAKSEGFDVKVRIEIGDIDKRIVETAEDENADLIIMGSGTQNSIKKLFFGSLVDDVTRQAPCPVLAMNTEKVSRTNKFYDLQAYRERKQQERSEQGEKRLVALSPRFH